ncbi:MAG: Flp family type IVb pilin [Bryobacteraceae bacterium]|jgi:Flp pilus assembly pilin Flp
MQLLIHFWRDESGQDLIEYSLLITFIAIACLALIGAGRPSVNGIWIGTNTQLSMASTAASGS